MSIGVFVRNPGLLPGNQTESANTFPVRLAKPTEKLGCRSALPFHRVLRQTSGKPSQEHLTWRRPEDVGLLAEEGIKFDDTGKLLSRDRIWSAFKILPNNPANHPKHPESVPTPITNQPPVPVNEGQAESWRRAAVHPNADLGYLARKERFSSVAKKALFNITGFRGPISDEIAETVATSASIREYELAHPNWSLSGNPNDRMPFSAALCHPDVTDDAASKRTTSVKKAHSHEDYETMTPKRKRAKKTGAPPKSAQSSSSGNANVNEESGSQLTILKTAGAANMRSCGGTKRMPAGPSRERKTSDTSTATAGTISDEEEPDLPED